MSNETHDNQYDYNSSVSSRRVLNDNTRDKDVESPSSRLSSASKKNEGQPFAFVNESSDQNRIKSPVSSRQDTNQLDKNKLRNDNQSPSNSYDDDEQAVFNFHSRSSSHANEPSNDGPTISNRRLISVNDEQNQLNQSGNSVGSTTEENQQHPRRKQNTKYHNDEKKPHAPKLDQEQKPDTPEIEHEACQFRADKKWLDMEFHDIDVIKKPDELQDEMDDPPGRIDQKLLDRIQGSMIGMALGDALGAHVEFRPRQYLKEHPVKDLEGGGTWGLQKGQFTDDTSMALCLANSLLARKDFIPYDQLVRYKWWYKSGYMSSTGQCFDIGAATSQSLREFEHRQKTFAEENKLPLKQMDKLHNKKFLDEFDVYCSEDDVAGNGALMRLAPVPLFFFRNKYAAVEFSGRSGKITHGDKKAYDACRYYGALIVATLHGFEKEKILAKNFYSAHKHWFDDEELHPDILRIAEGSFKKKPLLKKGMKREDYIRKALRVAYLQNNIRGKGYIVSALEAALWAFWCTNSFEEGALAAVNLGDDTDTTAAIYGQLAGAYYGYNKLPPNWLEHVYAHKFMKQLSKWIAYEGEQWDHKQHADE